MKLLFSPLSWDLKACTERFVDSLGTHNLLFTSSCRAALFLAYRALGLSGKVIVSPLTCEDAITPIVAAGLRPEFADVCPLTFNLCPTSVKEHIDAETVAIQPIYLGGNPSGASALAAIASQNDLALIEDCAHALGARDQGQKVGTWGDAGCFNFTKSLHGAGGALVGHTAQLIENAIGFQREWPRTPTALVGFRLVRTLLSSLKSRLVGHYSQALLMQIGRILAPADPDAGPDRIYHEVSRPRPIEMHWAAYQLDRWQKIVTAQKTAAELLTSALRRRVQGIQLQVHLDGAEGVYTRYLLRVPIESKQVNRTLREHGVDAKHLRQQHGALYQERFDRVKWLEPYIRIAELPNYQALHEHLIALPLYVGLCGGEANVISEALAYALHGATKSAFEAHPLGCLEACEFIKGEYSEYLV